MFALDRHRTIDRWFQEYGNDIYRFLVYLTGRTDMCEDLLQETFTRAYDKFHQFRNDSSPKTWLLQIARNLAIDATRKNRRIFMRETPTTTTDMVSRDVGPEEATILVETTRWVLAELANINPNFSKVLLLRGIEDLSSKDSAKILGWSVAKVNVTYHRALKAAEGIVDDAQRSEGWF